MQSNLLRRKVRRTTLISFGSAAILIGIGIGRTECFVSIEMTIASTVLLWLCRRRVLVLAIPIVVAVGLMFGIARGSNVMNQLHVYSEMEKQKVELVGAGGTLLGGPANVRSV